MNDEILQDVVPIVKLVTYPVIREVEISLQDYVVPEGSSRLGEFIIGVDRLGGVQ